MSKCASDVVKQAQAWLGKKEQDGSFNEIIDLYNSHKPLARGYKVKYTDEWCATFVSAVAIKLGMTDIIPTECSCQKQIEKFKELGCWEENEAVEGVKPGWVIYYDWNDSAKDYEKNDCKGWSDHVGIVEEVSSGIIKVIEGNYNSRVGRRFIKINDKYVRGYGIPKYDSEPVFYPKYKGTSVYLDKILADIGVPSKFLGTWAKRKPIALANGISNYSGTANQNGKLISLAKQGKLKRV